MVRRPNIYSAIALVTGMLLCACSALAQASRDLDVFVGRWQINLAETKMGRMGPNSPPNVTRSSTFTFVFAPAGSNLRMLTYTDYPQAAPTYNVLVIPDGKQHKCDLTNPCHTIIGDTKNQTYAYVKVHSHLMVRLLYVDGEVSEYTSYAVSSDSKVFTMIAWSAKTPQWQNIQVFEKQM